MNVSPNTSGLSRALSLAIEYGSKSDILKVLEEDEVDLGLTTTQGDTIAHLIFQNKNCSEEDVIELLQTLFNQGIDPNVENSREETVLCLAVAKRMRSIVDFLVKRKVDITKTDKDGYSITHFFIQDENRKFFQLLNYGSGHFKISSHKLDEIESESANFVEWLIGKGFDFDSRNNFGMSALDLSIQYNLHQILIVLLKHTNDIHYVTKCNETLLHLFFRKCTDYRERYGCNSRYTATIVKILLDKGVSAVAVASNGASPLSIAFASGQEITIIEMIINHLLKTCTQNNLSTNVLVELSKSCAFWDESKVEYYLTILGTLVAEGVSVNSRDKHGKTPLHWAFLAKNVRAVKFLEDHGADFSVIDGQGKNLFHELALSPYYDKSTNEEKEALFELLLSKGCCDMHGRDRNQDTPLHLACRMRTKENLVTARKLIEHGAEVNCKNQYGYTPLHYAVLGGTDDGVAMAELLLESGANVNSKNKNGNRPIYCAIESEKMMQLFLKWRACVNVKTKPLSFSIFSGAVVCNNLFIAKELLAYGADINPLDIYYRFVSYPIACNCSLRELILQHWIKLDAAKLPCSKEYEMASRCFDYNKQLRNDCCTEIKVLKSTFIDNDKRTSLYAFLHMDVGSRRMHINNEKLKNLVDSPDLERQFPQYSVLILASYRETATWKALLQPAKQALGELSGITTITKQSKVLPDLCSELILGYLKSEELLSVIDCVEDELSQ